MSVPSSASLRRNLGDKFTQAGSFAGKTARGFVDQARVKARKVGVGVSRTAQILAVLTLPFFLVAAMAIATVLKDVLLSVFPDSISSMAPITFLLGTFLVVATFAVSFAWVKTGGFHVF